MRRNAGLTIIEAMAVLVVILTLVLVAVPSLLSARVRAEVTRVQQDMQVVESALKWYYLDYRHYPESSGADLLSSLPRGSGDEEHTRGLYRLVTHQYLEYLPQERFPEADVSYAAPQVYQFGSSGRSRAVNDLREGSPAWILVSPGPNKVSDSESIPAFPFGTVVWKYDPTKGPRSDGDLVRYGGDWQFGDWYLDGQRIKGD